MHTGEPSERKEAHMTPEQKLRAEITRTGAVNRKRGQIARADAVRIRKELAEINARLANL